MTARPAAEALLGADADRAFGALADPTRRQILVRLAERPDDAGAVARDLDLTRQAVAKQLRLLEEAGIVSATRQSRRRVHAVEASRLREISDLLGLVAQGWDRRLAGIRDEAERREQERDPTTSDRPSRR
ncbi:ArsR/SmtB family transcription factor [Brachybacterium sp. AOP43-C2-M15]|uniref:ArsR/SmtB family transcription factor n=1 Tax=Brachybacterium sp. AOP43-C2-M15 TaxID=3457661 RepID=UPI0040333253